MHYVCTYKKLEDAISSDGLWLMFIDILFPAEPFKIELGDHQVAKVNRQICRWRTLFNPLYIDPISRAITLN